MTDQELRADIRRALDARLSGLSPDPHLAQRLIRASADAKPRRLPLRIIMLAALLLVSILCVGFAAVGRWRLDDYFRGLGNQVPMDFASGFQQQPPIICGELRFEVVDAQVMGHTAMALVEISRSDGQPALFLPSPSFTADNPIQKLYPSLPDQITIGEYAQQKGLPLHYSGCALTEAARAMSSGSGDMWMKDDRTLVYMTTTNDIFPTGDAVTLFLNIQMFTEEGVWDTVASYSLTLPVSDSAPRTLEIGQLLIVDGMNVSVDRVTLREVSVGYQLDCLYSLPNAQPGEAELLSEYDLRLVTPATGALLPDDPFYHPPQRLITEDGSPAFLLSDLTVSRKDAGEALYFQFLRSSEQRMRPDGPTLSVPLTP